LENAADPLHVGGAGLSALSDAELSTLIEVGVAGGMWARHKLDPGAVRVLLGLALLWPKGRSAVGLTAKGVQVLAEAAGSSPIA
jgi:hypothetical protein